MSKCAFCEKAESAFVELLCWNPVDCKMARETLFDGVCTDHANLLPAGVDSDFAPFPAAYRARRARLIALFCAQFPNEGEVHFAFGLRYHAYHSAIGQQVRMRRTGLANKDEIGIRNPLLEMPVDRVATIEDYNEIMGVAQAGKGAIFSDGGKKKA